MPFTDAERDCARHFQQHVCICRRVFQNSVALVKHLRRLSDGDHNGYGSFTCNICQGRSFKTKNDFVQHLRDKRRHVYDLHQAACCGEYQHLKSFLHSQCADKTGESHSIGGSELLYQCGFTPLHCAAFKGYTKCLKIMLLWPDGDPNARDKYDGQTPVHIAAKFGKASTLKLLLTRGGRLDLKDKNGLNAEQLARFRRHKGCVDVIENYKFEKMMKDLMLKLNYLVEDVAFRTTYERDTLHMYSVAGGENSGRSTEDSTLGDEFGACAKTERDSAASTFHLPRSAAHEGNTSNNNDNKNTKQIFEFKLPSGEQTEAATCQVIKKFHEVCTLSEETEKEPSKERSQCTSSLSVINEPANEEIYQVHAEILPDEILARGEKSVNAFKVALSEGQASTSRLKLIIVGDVGAGKTCLCRSLCNQPFLADRHETLGIEISESMLKKTELNVSWQSADSEKSDLDEIIATIVAEHIRKNSQNVDDDNQVAQSPSYGLASPGLFPAEEPSSSMIAAQPFISVEGTSRKMPVAEIAKRLHEKVLSFQSVKISIWDFAGHRLYETMHHIFMNDKSIYLVVFNLVVMHKKREDCLKQIQYWLNSIATHTSKSTPVMLVGTHRDEVPEECIKMANILCTKKFENSFGGRFIRKSKEEIVFAVENTLGQKDQETVVLINKIKNEASTSLPFVVEKIPVKWLCCEEEILALQKLDDTERILGREKLKKMLEESCKISFTDEEFSLMLSFYHDNGLLLLPDRKYNSTVSPSVKDLVVLSPQFLVDVMTKIHRIPDKDDGLTRNLQRDFQKLKNEGKAKHTLLRPIFEDLGNSDLLVNLLCHFNLLCPLPSKPNNPVQQDTSPATDTSFSNTDFIMPCMLKVKPPASIEKHWKTRCDNWSESSLTESILVFDFGDFLPQAFFDYLLVSINRYGQETKGMPPYITRHVGLFSISYHYLLKMELDVNNCMIWFFIRCAQGKQFINLATNLVERVNQISSQYFKVLKFIYGPPCPNEECPGAVFDDDDVQRVESSSDEESDDVIPGEEMPGTGTGTKRHIIPMNVSFFDSRRWCGSFRIKPDDLKDWNPSVIPHEDLPQNLGDDGDVTDGLRKLHELTAETFPLRCVKHEIKILGISEKAMQEICIKLNLKRELLGGDFRSLGHELGYTIEKLDVFEKLTDKNPTKSMFLDWNSPANHFAVEIRDILKRLRRDDVAVILERELTRKASEGKCECCSCQHLE